jgi:uncharacterized metal-binding protein
MTDEHHHAPERTIYCCSGASNVGVLSFYAAIRLAQEGFGSFACIAGIGSGNQPMIRAAKMAGERVLIDGCPTGCGRKIMEMNGVPVDRYIVVTELGIDKTHGLDIDESGTGIVVEEVKRPRQSSARGKKEEYDT